MNSEQEARGKLAPGHSQKSGEERQMKGNRTESHLSSSTTVARYLEMEKE